MSNNFLRCQLQYRFPGKHIYTDTGSTRCSKLHLCTRLGRCEPFCPALGGSDLLFPSVDVSPSVVGSRCGDVVVRGGGGSLVVVVCGVVVDVVTQILPTYAGISANPHSIVISETYTLQLSITTTCIYLLC